MSLISEDFKKMLDSYANTIPNYNLLFRITKGCGYSQLVTVPRNSTYMYTQPPLVSLLEQINLQMGECTRGKVFYYPKITDNASFNPHRFIHNEDLLQPLSTFALNNLQTAYSVDDCKYTVYQLYLESNCSHSCEEQHSIPMELDPSQPIAEIPPTPPAELNTYTPCRVKLEDLDYVM